MKKILFTFLFVLMIVPAAFADPATVHKCTVTSASGATVNVGPECTDQDWLKEYRSIKGTVVESGTNYQQKVELVTIIFTPSNPSESQQLQYTANPHFAFYIKKGVDGEIKFSKDGYDTVTLHPTDFQDYGRYVEMTPSSSKATGATSSTPGTIYDISATTTDQQFAIEMYTREVQNFLVRKYCGGSGRTSCYPSPKITCANGATPQMTQEESSILCSSTYNISYDRNTGMYTVTHASSTSGSTGTSSGTRSGGTRSSGASTTRTATTSGAEASAGVRLNTITGRVIDTKKQPIPGVGITPKDENIKKEYSNTTTTDQDGNFTLTNFPRNTDAKVEALSYKTKYIAATDLKPNMTIVMEDEVFAEDGSTLLDTSNVASEEGVLDCNNQKQRILTTLNAQHVKWKSGQAAGLASKCIPTSCKNNYILEKEDTLDAVCTSCDGRVPLAQTTKTENNQCVPDQCKKGLVRVGNQCLVDCSTQAVRTKLNATAAARKSDNPPSERADGDYSSYCYATACDLTKSAAKGTGADTRCASNANTSCINSMKEVEPFATVAKFDGNGLCKLEGCTEGYDVTDTRGSAKCGENITGLRCSGKCKVKVGTECDLSTSVEYARLVKGTLDNNGLCVPKCYENYEAKLTGSTYSCKKITDKCPDKIAATKPDAAKNGIQALEWDDQGNVKTCKITECDDKTKTPAADFQTCVAKCSPEQRQALKDSGHALETTTNNKGECIISKCQCGYTLTKQNTCEAWGNNHPKCDKKTDPKIPENAKSAHMECDNSEPKQAYCKIDECKDDSFDKKPNAQGLADTICDSILDKQCTVDEKVSGQYASDDGKWAYNNSKRVCVPDSCTTRDFIVNKKNGKCELTCKNGLVPNADESGCVESNCDCGQRWNKTTKQCEPWAKQECDSNLPKHATAGKLQCKKSDNTLVATCPKADKCKEVCVVTTCEGGYKPNQKTNKCDIPSEPCTFSGNMDHVTGSTWVEHRGVLTCEPKCDGSNFEPEWDNTKKKFTGCVIKKDKTGKKCPDELLKKTDTHASRGEITEQDANGNATKCEITDCENGYRLNKTNKTCEESPVGKPCPTDQLPENAASGTLQEQGGTIVCIVSTCVNGYELRPDGVTCVPKMVLSREDYQDEIAELSDNAQKMHEKETSLGNRIIGAVGIGATGIGGMMVGAAISEGAADAAAERAMTSYVQSMHCEYGNGHNVKGGEINVELPGGNDMISLYTEYAQLANDLKIRKEALGIRPGIESEVVIDKSQTGLYDDVGTGITGGTYASIARAIMNPEGEDAAMWAAQKEATKQKLTAGAITAGVGAIGSGVANVIVNHKNPNRSDEIKRKYAPLKQAFDDLERRVSNPVTPVFKCEDFQGGATGTYPSCTCTDDSKRFFRDQGGCFACDDGKVYNNKNECVCPDGTAPDSTSPAICVAINANTCLFTGDIVRLDNGTCKCIDDIQPVENVCTCPYGKTDEGNHCKTKPQVDDHSSDNIPDGTVIAEIELSADTLFETGKAEFTLPAVTELFIFNENVAEQVNIDLKTSEDYCLVIVGKTDRVPVKRHQSIRNNQELSEKRAQNVATFLRTTFNKANMLTYGIADKDCTTPTYARNDERCRSVTVKMLGGSCDENKSNNLGWISKIVTSDQAIKAITEAIKTN